jgi:hypothetical protein
MGLNYAAHDTRAEFIGAPKKLMHDSGRTELIGAATLSYFDWDLQNDPSASFELKFMHT